MLFFMFSCKSNDIQNLTISGTVKDSETNKVVSEIEVVLICWKYGDSPDQSYSEEEKVTLKTNSKGKYSHTFDKGAYIEVKVLSPNYKKYHEAKEVYEKKNTFDIFLNSN